MDELRLNLFLFFLNYWRLYKNRGVDMGDVWRAICESMPDFPVCAFEGCDTVLVNYKITAFFCCHEHAKKAWDEANKRKDYHKAYNQTPERKAWNKARTQTPEYKEYKKDYDRARYKTPEYRDYQRDYYARKKAERLAAIEAE